jgi:hypothetical protein
MLRSTSKETRAGFFAQGSLSDYLFRKRSFLIQLKKRSRPGCVLLLQRILGNPYLEAPPIGE